MFLKKIYININIIILTKNWKNKLKNDVLKNSNFFFEKYNEKTQV
jgi:hypothetical protein